MMIFAECRSTQIVGGAGTIGGAFSLINQDGETVSDKDVITEPSLSILDIHFVLMFVLG